MGLGVGERDANPGQDLHASHASAPVEEGFGLYVHWPFCLAKCPYCDFNSHVRHQGVDAMGYAKSLIPELNWMRDRTPGRVVGSIFFGGGTPSLMPPEAVAAILDHIAKSWAISKACEITLEANPTSAEAENFRGYRSAGVNRLSVGVQALKDEDLQALGRRHTASEALAAYRLAARIFPRTSFDLIYARPGQSVQSWRDELSIALSEQQGHMSLYQLTIEPDTVFSALHAKGSLIVPDEDDALALWETTQKLTGKAGLFAYEVSNHAVPGAESRHNLNYWRYGEYGGVGPGAHSRLIGEDGRRIALSAEKHPETWRGLVAARGSGIVEELQLTREEQAEEYLLMGLRLAEGIDLARHTRLGGTLSPNRLKVLSDQGFVTIGDRLAATPSGRRVLNSLIAAIAA